MKLPHLLWTACLCPLFSLTTAGVAGAVTPGQPPDADIAHAAPAPMVEMTTVPGPLRSFLRMAGISQEVRPDEVMPLLARNVSLRGYDRGQESEYLVLLRRYVQFARDLQSLAGPQNIVRVDNCEQAARLVDLLGYRFERTCGQDDADLVTENAQRAFLAVDSGFPLASLEESLQKHKPFAYEFPAASVPVLFHERDWTNIGYWKDKTQASLLDVLLHDQGVDRLYWALSRSDDETRAALAQPHGLRVLLPWATALDLYGSQISVRGGHVVVPGGQAAEPLWQELAGASPRAPEDFVQHLCSRDRGWLVAWFDALSRVSREQQVHLTANGRLRQLYDVYRRAGGQNSATHGMYPQNGELLVLLSDVRWQANGDPYVPGNLSTWRGILDGDTSPKLIRGWVKNAHRWDSPEQLLMTLVATAGFPAQDAPLQVYLTLSAIDAARAPDQRLDDRTVRLMADKFEQLHRWYLAFSEFPALDDASIRRFIEAADAVTALSGQSLRANALGALQANIGIWEILARQREIPAAAMNTSWQGMVQPFVGISSSARLFEAARSSLAGTVAAAGGDRNLSQDEIVELLAGPAQQSDDGRRAHRELAERIRSVLDDQRLVSLDTLFALSDGLGQLAHGAGSREQLVPLAGSLREFEMPRPLFTSGEKATWAPQIYASRHAELQVRTDLTSVLQSGASPAQLERARGQLTPFLRDTLVGLNYAYYEPPGAQILHNNPLFVRSHDFSGTSVMRFSQIWDSPQLVGIGVTAGGGAYLLGSLADLPYALASSEEDFIVPENVQALIWQSVGPSVLVSAVQPRWWDVTPAELHAATLYQRMGEELLLAAPHNEELRGRATDILSDVLPPQRLEAAERALGDGAEAAALLPQIAPAEKFFLASEYLRRYPEEAAAAGPSARELMALEEKHGEDVSVARLSRDFGVPHPALEQTNACSLLNVKPLPAFAGQDFELMGESWDSTNLYWARLADEMGYSPVSLNLLVPELSRHMMAKIFATDMEDWPALLRAMEQTGEEFRQGGIHVAALDKVSQHQE